MKTKNSKRFGLFCLLALWVVGTQAQTWSYPKVESNNIIVSHDAAGGIKESALLTAEQKTFLMNQSSQPIYNEKSEYNRVSAKFQVASTDVESKTWADAYANCKSYSTGAAAGSWRLPTQRELMLIWIFHSKLTGFPPNPSPSRAYCQWAGTEESQADAWNLILQNGTITPEMKSGNIDAVDSYARCVRDL